MKIKNNFRIISLLVCFCLAFTGIAIAAETEATYLKLFINNEEMIFQNPISVSGNEVVVPLREVTELFGGKYDFMEEDKIAICTLGTGKLVAQADSRTGKIGTALADINPVPYMVGEELFVPLSFVAKGFNLTYSYDAASNAAYINQNPTVTPYYITNQTYVAKSEAGVYTASHNESASYYRMNTLSSAATGEMFYEIDITNVPEEFTTAKLVITASKINVRGTYYVHEVTSGLDGVKFGTLDFTENKKITLTETDKLPIYKEDPIAKTASALTAYLDLTEYVKSAKANGDTMLRLYLDYHTWETKASVDGSRMKSKGTTSTSPRLEITQDPDWVELPDISGIKIDYQKTPAKASERVLFVNGRKTSTVKNSANAGRSLNTLTTRGNKQSEITYTFPVKVDGNVKGANIVLFGRATQNGTILVTEKESGKSLTTTVSAGADYGSININVGELIDTSKGTSSITLRYTPDNGWGELYVYSINSDHAPELGITTQTVKE